MKFVRAVGIESKISTRHAVISGEGIEGFEVALIHRGNFPDLDFPAVCELEFGDEGGAIGSHPLAMEADGGGRSFLGPCESRGGKK